MWAALGFVEEVQHASVAKKQAGIWKSRSIKPGVVHEDGESEEKDPISEPDEEAGDLIQEYTVLLEYERLQDVLPLGMYVMPSYVNFREWFGAMFVRGGMYGNGIFKFVIDLPLTYPEDPPEIHFITEVFHPLVDPNDGQFQLEAFFPQWQAGRDCVAAALLQLHRSFRAFSDCMTKAEQPFNPDALQTFTKDSDLYAKRAAQCATRSLETLYENPLGCALQFSRLHTVAQETILEKLRAGDPQHSVDGRVQDFADWFCDSYAQRRTKIDVKGAQVEQREYEVLRVTAREEEGEGYPPAKGWLYGDSDTSDDESDEEDEHAADDARDLMGGTTKHSNEPFEVDAVQDSDASL